MEHKSKRDNTLISLIIIVILCGIVRIIGLELKFIMYACLLWHLKIMIFAKPDEYVPIILFNHTCSSLYDDIGFTYLFNLTIFIFSMKLLIEKNKISKKCFLLLSILFLYNIVLTIISGYYELNSILSSISLFVSYLLIILISTRINSIDYNKCYKYFFVGYIVSAISAFSLPYSKWGIKIPTSYRFNGYLRDSNYYSIDALLLMNISLIREKSLNTHYFVILLLGLLSISKMFLLLSILNLFIYFLLSIFSKKKKVFYVGMVFLIPMIFFALSRTSYYSLIVDKYEYRSEISSLFTGRDYIQEYYVTTLKNNPGVLVFGSSLNYRHLLGVGHNENLRYTDYGAHNTYLDLILSFGIIGTFIYIALIRYIYMTFKRDNNKLQKEYYFLLCTIIISLFALSYLNIDFFAIIILLLIIYNSKVMGNSSKHEVIYDI